MTQLIWQECFYDRQLSLYESYLGSSLHRRGRKNLYIVAEIWQNTKKDSYMPCRAMVHTCKIKVLKDGINPGFF